MYSFYWIINCNTFRYNSRLRFHFHSANELNMRFLTASLIDNFWTRGKWRGTAHEHFKCEKLDLQWMCVTVSTVCMWRPCVRLIHIQEVQDCTHSRSPLARKTSWILSERLCKICIEIILEFSFLCWISNRRQEIEVIISSGCITYYFYTWRYPSDGLLPPKHFYRKHADIMLCRVVKLVCVQRCICGLILTHLLQITRINLLWVWCISCAILLSFSGRLIKPIVDFFQVHNKYVSLEILF